MNVLDESLGHFLATDVGYGVKCETVGDLVVVSEVLANRIDDEAQEVRVLVHE